ncbi:unnamed protein product [Aphanomyces euteiches]
MSNEFLEVRYVCCIPSNDSEIYAPVASTAYVPMLSRLPNDSVNLTFYYLKSDIPRDQVDRHLVFNLSSSVPFGIFLFPIHSSIGFPQRPYMFRNLQ